MYINEEIREDIRTVYGLEKQLGSDKDYMDLRDDIQEQTGGKVLDINTLKRVMDHWGKEKRGEEDYRYSVKTLNIIALYLGYRDWEGLKRGFGKPRGSIIVPPIQYNKGDRLVIVYEPSRRIYVEALGNHRWKVLRVEGGRLQEGDEFIVRSFRRYTLLILNDLKRGNVILGDYISSGLIFSITLHRAKKE